MSRYLYMYIHSCILVVSKRLSEDPVKKMYRKTSKLSDARFRGQKALVVEALSTCSTPVSLETLAPLVDRNGRYNALLNEWARENGGVKGSLLYHLRALKRLGMVEETFGTAAIKTQIVAWGNSQALRIPRALLQELQIGEGDEVEMSAENGRLSVRPLRPKLTLQSLVAAITPENRHKEIDWGKPVGSEVW
jgi:antitoxin MazE